MSQYNELRPSYEELHNACFEIVENIVSQNLKPKAIIGVLRGGIVPAVILSHMLGDLPVIAVDYSSKKGKGDDKNHTNLLPIMRPSSGPVLIVDDICDSGATLEEISNHFTECGVPFYTAVMFWKAHENQMVVPNFVWKTIPADSGWVDFAYERNELLLPDTEMPTRYLKSMVGG